MFDNFWGLLTGKSFVFSKSSRENEKM